MPSASTNFATEAMFELELEMLDKQIGDLEMARVTAAKEDDEQAVRAIDEQLERLWTRFDGIQRSKRSWISPIQRSVPKSLAAPIDEIFSNRSPITGR